MEAEITTPRVVTFEPSPDECGLSGVFVERALGYRRGNASGDVALAVAELLPLARDYIDLRCGVVILTGKHVGVVGDEFVCGLQRLQIGPTIAARLRDAVTAAVFVVTAGSGLEGWSVALTQSGDLFRALVVDAIGSAATERAAIWLETKVAELAAHNGWNVTSRYGPGYCGWPTSDQHALFSLLPTGFCGVTLTDSALMLPVKSISGVIGLGPTARREGYRCETCELEDCFRRGTEP